MKKKYTVDDAIEATFKGTEVYTKFLTRNDTRANPKNHQNGVLISQNAESIVCPKLMNKDEKGNLDRYIKIDFYHEKYTKTESGVIEKKQCFVSQKNSRFISYASKKGEYRITRIPKIEEENIGALFVLVRMANDAYQAFIFNDDLDVDKYLDTCGGFPLEENYEIREDDTLGREFVDNLMKKIRTNKISKRNILECFFSEQVKTVKEKGYPNAEEMVKKAHKIRSIIDKDFAQSTPDEMLLKGFRAEYVLFRAIEAFVFKPMVCKKKFRTVGEFAYIANKVLNARKSRAGKSFENQLLEVFKINGICLDFQVRTEDGYIPDFIFPSKKMYELAEKEPDLEKRKKIINNCGIVFLAAKTTCKERWNQILSEVKILEETYLCTLQSIFSQSQLEQMRERNVRLVIPGLKDENNPGPIEICNPKYGNMMMSLTSFVKKIKEMQNIKCEEETV